MPRNGRNSRRSVRRTTGQISDHLPELFVLALLFLSSCSLNSVTEPKIQCPQGSGGTEAQVCGNLRRLLLGPADQIEGTEAVSGAMVLFANIEGIPGLDRSSPLEVPHADLYGRMERELNPTAIRTDEEGFFYSEIPPGETLLCLAFKPGWSPDVNSYGCTVLSLGSGDQIRLRVEFTPMGGFFNFQIE
jgi:hypothetical protein